MRGPDPKTVSFASIEPRMRTGDILIFHGTSPTSKQVEKTTASRFSHAAMVIRPDITKPPYIWQTGPGPIVSDPLTGGKHGGAQLGRMLIALKTMFDPDGDQGYWRQLKFRRTPAFETMAKVIVSDIEGRPFPTLRQMVAQQKAGLKHRVESDRTLFCAELVAETLMRMGLLGFDPPPNAYEPKFFSQVERPLNLLKGATLGPEYKIALPR